MELTCRAFLCTTFSLLLWVGQALGSGFNQLRIWCLQRELTRASTINDTNDLLSFPRAMVHWAEYVSRDMRYETQEGNRYRQWMQLFHTCRKQIGSVGRKLVHVAGINASSSISTKNVHNELLPLFQSPYPEYRIPPPMPGLKLPPSIADGGCGETHTFENGRWAWEYRKKPKPWALNDPSTHWDYSPQPKVLILNVMRPKNVWGRDSDKKQK